MEPQIEAEETPEAASPPASRRPFTLLDAMIVIALTALGLMPYRLVVPGLRSGLPEGGLVEVVFQLQMLAALLTCPMGLAWTAAVLALRLRGSAAGTPPARCQPGILAAGTALGLVALIGPLHGLSYSLVSGIPLYYMPFLSLIIGGRAAGFGVLGVRLALWIAGPPRPTSDWVDGLGRALSWYWIALGLIAPPSLD